PSPTPPTWSARTRAIRLDRAVAAPVALGDRVGVLVPVPGAGVLRVVLGRLGWIQRIARPLDRQRLVHEAAVRAVERKALARGGPRVRRARTPAVGQAVVAAVAHEPLSRATGVHREGHLLVVLGDREASRVGPHPRAGMSAPGGGQQADQLAPVEREDRVMMAPPAAVHALRPRLGHGLVSQLLLDE